MFALSSMPGKGFKRIYLRVLKIFDKALKIENCPKIIMALDVRKKKKKILRIVIDNFDKTFSAPRNHVRCTFGFISIYHLWCKSTVWNISATYSKSNIHEFLFLYIWFAVQHSFSYGYQSVWVKSNLHKIHVLWFHICGFPFIVAIEISIPLKFISHQTSI